MKYFIVSDVHSFYKPLMKALNSLNFNSGTDTLISLGDLFDRGPDSVNLLDFIDSLPNKILIRGNHDTALEDIRNLRRYPNDIDEHNGTIRTIMDLGGHDNLYDNIRELSRNEKLYNYLKSLRNYYETDDYLFVHGWFPYDEENYTDYYKTASQDEWDSATWDNGFVEYQIMNRSEKPINKTVVFGHYHTSFGHHYLNGDGKEFPDKDLSECNFSIFNNGKIIGMDACTALTGKCNCLVLKM